MSADATSASLRCGGIVLCGGKSSRMGRPKLSLPFGDETLLERVVRILGEVVSPIVVVAAADQDVPKLIGDVILARDEQPALGPLGGLAVGLEHLAPHAAAAYAAPCDAPLLKPAFVTRMIELLGDRDMVICREGRFHHPLAAVYSTRLETDVRKLIAAERMRPLFLVERCNARIVEIDELRDVDPELHSLRNTNTPEEYAAALRDAGC